MDPISIAMMLLGGGGFLGGGTQSGQSGNFLKNLLPFGLGGLLAGSGRNQIKQGQELAARNPRPILNESGIYDNLLGMFEQQAQYGLDKNALQFASTANQQSLSETLNTMLTLGGSPNAVSSAYGAYADSNTKLAEADADRRWQKVQAVAGATDRLFDARREEFLYNEDAPYKDTAQISSNLQQTGYQQEMVGKDFMMSSLLKGFNEPYGSANQQTPIQQMIEQFKNLFGGNASGSGASASSSSRSGDTATSPDLLKYLQSLNFLGVNFTG